MVTDDENDQGYYDDIPISQEEVRKQVLDSIRLNNDNPEVIEQMLKTTPRDIKIEKALK